MMIKGFFRTACIPFFSSYRCEAPAVFLFGLLDLWVAEHMSAPWCPEARSLAGTLAGDQTDPLLLIWQVRIDLKS